MDDVTSLLVGNPLFSVRTGLWNEEVMTLIEGTPSDWKGTARVTLYGPDGSASMDWTVPMVSSSELDLRYRFESDGHSTLNITMQGLPLLINTSESLAGGVTNLPRSVTVDTSTPPLVGGGLTLALVALVVRKRLSSVSPPAEWEI